METNETALVSPHMIRVVAHLQHNQAEWVTAKQIADGARVAPRTARAHALRLLQLGMVEEHRAFGGFRYRWSMRANARNRAFIERLQQAAMVLKEEV